VLVFLAVVMSILGAGHYYVWARLVRDLAWPAPWHEALSAVWLLLYASIPLTLLFGARVPRRWSRWVLTPSYVWLGAIFLLLVAVAATDLVRTVGTFAYALFAPGSATAWDTLLTRQVGLAAAALGISGSALALVEGARLRVRQVEVPLSRLPRARDGLRIVQLSDVHVGPSLGVQFVRKVVAKVNGLQPDLVVITGDLVDGPVEALGAAVAELRHLESRFGTFFVTGNHEYYSGAAAWCSFLTELGVRVLRNERVSIGDGPDGFDLAGIDDYHGAQFHPSHGPDLKRALAGRDPRRELVLLAHQPKAIHEASAQGVGLQLSGHTHGGQIWPFSWLVKLQQPIVSGLQRVGSTWVYVSNGTGYWGPPMRLGAPAEISLVVLRANTPSE
jgi:predicted MPP superfamily phosphohydrolase